MRKTYPTDLSDAQWTRLQPYLPTPKAEGRPRTHSLRDVLDAIFFYVLKSGCHWRLLPHDFLLRGLPRLLPFQKIPIERVVVLHPQRAACGREEEGGQGSSTDGRHIMDSQSVKNVEENRPTPKWLRRPQENLKGRSKRHLLVDTPRVFRSRFTSVRPTYKIGLGHNVFWLECEGAFAPIEEDLGGWGLHGREVGQVVQRAGRMGTRDRRTE
jgi:hypothetical protein